MYSYDFDKCNRLFGRFRHRAWTSNHELEVFARRFEPQKREENTRSLEFYDGGVRPTP
jgi:hypothetical protein